jgi:hypothetical protein
MALWGNKDGKTASGTVTIVGETGAVTGSSTAFTTEAKVGNFIRVAGEDYRITAIADDTNATVVAAKHGATMTGRSGDAYTLSEKPVFVSAAESSGSASGVHGDTTKVYGVDAISNGENYAAAGLVVEVAIAVAGTGYIETPTVTFSGGGGSGAAATATVSGGSVTALTLTNNGSSYEDLPTVNIDVPRRTIATSAVNTTSEEITYTGHGLANGEALKYYANGGTAIGGLTNATTYYAIRTGANTFKLAATRDDAIAEVAVVLNITGTGNNAQYFDLTDATTATAVATLGGGNGEGESRSNITHTGWVRRTVGTGGRAGRVFYETLVAGGSITGDQADDMRFPDD